jgi:hypothetical protein
MTKYVPLAVQKYFADTRTRVTALRIANADRYPHGLHNMELCA